MLWKIRCIIVWVWYGMGLALGGSIAGITLYYAVIGKTYNLNDGVFGTLFAAFGIVIVFCLLGHLFSFTPVFTIPRWKDVITKHPKK